MKKRLNREGAGGFSLANTCIIKFVHKKEIYIIMLIKTHSM